jgi:hypothetical protein
MIVLNVLMSPELSGWSFLSCGPGLSTEEKRKQNRDVSSLAASFRLPRRNRAVKSITVQRGLDDAETDTSSSHARLVGVRSHFADRLTDTGEVLK